MNKLGKVAVALAMAFSVGAALTASAKEYSLKEGDDLEKTLATARADWAASETDPKEPSVITLGKGTYTLTQEMYLDWPVTLVGATGDPDDVIVEGNKKFRICTINNADAEVKDLTIAKGFFGFADVYDWGNAGVRICAPGNSDRTNKNWHTCSSGKGGRLTHCIVKDCSTTYFHCWGIVYLDGPKDKTIVDRCVIRNNTHSGQENGQKGKGDIVTVQSGIFRNSLVRDNTTTLTFVAAPDSRYQGIVTVCGSNGEIVGCTVANNWQKGENKHQVAGVLATAGKVVNTIIANNRIDKPSDAQDRVWHGTASCFVNCVTDWSAPINDTCLSVNDVGFADTENDDYRILTESAAIGAGSATASGAMGNLDLAGNPRLRGDIVDAGAYAMVEGGETLVRFTATPSGVGREPMAVTFVGFSVGLGQTLEYQWDYDADGVIDEVTPTNAVLKEFSYGEYSVALTVVNTQTGASQSATRENLLNVKLGSHVYDVFETDGEYALEDKIAWIGEQFGAKEVPQTIRLHPGTYKLSRELYIDWPLTICGSTENPDDVTIEGDKTFRLCTINHADAEVKDVTLAKGRYNNEGATYGWGTSGVRICKPSNLDRSTSGWHICSAGVGGKLTHCIVKDCSTTYYHCWGIVYLDGPKDKTLVDRCVITGNSVWRQSNAAKGEGNILTVVSGIARNSMIAKNTVSYYNGYETEPQPQMDGVVCVNGDNGVMLNCTVAGNVTKDVAFNAVAGIYATKGTVVNCLMYGNELALSQSKPNNYTYPADKLERSKAWEGKASCFVNCWTDNAAPINETCVAGVDPQFLAAALGDYHILKTSPCRNVGTNDVTLAMGDKDLYGLPRTNVVDGAVTLDLGACQYDPNAVVAAASCEIPPIRYDNVEVVFNVIAAGFGDAPRYYWDFDGDGVTDYVTDAASFTHRLGIGAYAASVVTSNLEDSVGLKTVVEGGSFEVLPRPVHFVDVNGKNPVAPYWTAETAATNIQDGIDVALQGEEVRILPGVYRVRRSLVVTNDYTIVGGATGNPEDVIVRAVTESNRCMQVNAGSRALVHSLVLENGRCGDGSIKLTNNGHGPCLSIADTYISVSGVNCLEMLGSNHKGGIVSNCVIRGGSFGGNKFQRSGGVFLCGANALLTHCVVSNNTNNGGFSDNGWFGAAGVFLHNGARAENCLVIKNKSGSGNYYQAAVVVGDRACLRYSTVTGNNCALVGGVNVFGTGRFEKCVIADNTLSKSDTTDPRHKVWGAFNSGMDNYNRSNLKTDLANEEIRHADEAVQTRVTTNASDLAEADLGPGSLTVDIRKLFASPKRGDFHPRPSSPTVDAVPPEAETAAMPQADLKGNPRLFGDGYDLGAVEGNYKGMMLLVK